MTLTGEPPGISFDTRLRQEAMAWLTVRTNDGADWLTREDILDFTLDGESRRLQPTQQGIWKPRDLPAALSFQTVYRAPGKERPYNDEPGPDGMLRYAWRGEDPDQADNRALRAAMELEKPLIWFYGVGMGPAVFQAIFPVYILWEEPENKQFIIDLNVGRGIVNQSSPLEEHLRRYLTVETKRRLHQPVFRSTVLHAYRSRCAVCSLAHKELLDAAHIVADRYEGGIASVVNGLALCKIHHAAFDAHILGIRPDMVVEVREDILREVDGPMLRHGIQERHGQPLMVLPGNRAEMPDPGLLDIAYAEFRSA
ncbi:HNH endonuclease [Pseudarthrobacter sp. NIBRBAC000502771]|uniref:HNH endonuclease n=1 Tax=Pseudarthrobacter sp. NIBRBAC000502771 TaxID=2590774 RepID=UPI001AEFA388|nr:HNH endonuclease [Pseudarthrobacter sp. NIBRBAC000502771]